jgi:general secretion pathway protein C
MGSVLSWTANGVLFAVGCFLAADTANQILVAALLPSSPTTVAPSVAQPPPRPRTWAERQIILTRNLFHSSTEASAGVAAVEENIEASRLPVTLLGTFASSDPALSRATLQDREKNDTLVVGVGDQIKNTALVTRIERRRVVLMENGAPRELTIEEPTQGPGSIQRASAPRAPTRSARPARRAAVSVPREQVQEAVRNPADLLSQARILPKYEEGQMVGLQVNGIKPGSVLEEVGLEDGDVITQVNGIAITSPEESARVLQELATGESPVVVVDGPNGPKTFNLPN